MRPILASATLCVVPLRSGSGTRLKILEAMAMGVVPVCSDIGGAREMIDHGDDGFVFPPGNVDSLEQHLLELLTNAELMRRLGLRAQRKVREKFTIEVMDSEYVNLLTSVESG